MNEEKVKTLEGFYLDWQINRTAAASHPKRGELIRFLTTDVYYVRDIVEIIKMGGFEPGYIDLHGAAFHVWFEVVNYAQNRGEMDALFKCLIRYYSTTNFEEHF